MWIVLGLVAIALLASRQDAGQKPVGAAPAGQPAQQQGDLPPIQTRRYKLTTVNKRVDQPYIESLFVEAAVNGWYLGGTTGTCTIEIRDTDLVAAEGRLGILADVERLAYADAPTGA